MTFPTNMLAGLGAGGDVAGNATVRLGVATGGFRQQVRQFTNGIHQELQAGQEQIKRGADGWTRVFGAIKLAAIGTGVGVAGALATGVASAISYESAFAGVIKTVDAAPAVLERLKKRFRELSTEIPISANEFARLGEAAGALGVPVDQIEEFTKVTALLGVTTDVSSDQAATALGQLSNVLNLTGEDYNKFASTLVDLGNKGASTESQILEIASRAGAAGRLIGLSTPDILGFSSAVANLGIEVEAGGTALQTLFMQLQLFMNDREKLALLGKTAGMTGKQFKEAFQRDARGALIDFFTGLGKQSDGGVAVLDALGLSGVRTSRAFLGMASTMKQNVEPALDNANEAWKANNALQNEAQKRFETTASKLTLIKNRLGDVLLSLGDAVLPKVNEFIGAVADGIPRAFDHVQRVWNTTLGPAVRRIGDAIGTLAGTILSIFTGGDKAVDWGKVVAGAFDTVVGVLSTTLDFLSDIVGVLNTLLGNEVVGNIVRFVALWVGFRVALDGAQRALRGILGMGRGGGLAGAANYLTFGAVPAPGSKVAQVTAAGQAAEAGSEAGGGGGHELEVVARELRHAAHALEGAAAALKGAAMGGGPLPLLTGGAGAAGGMAEAKGIPLLTTSALGRAEEAGQLLWQKSAYAVTNAARRAADGPFGLARQAAGDAAGAGRMLLGSAASALTAPFRAIAAGGRAVAGSEGMALMRNAARDAAGAGRSLASSIAELTVNGVRGAVSGGARGLRAIGRGVSSAINTASAVFWPAMAGLLLADLAKAPIGDFVSRTLGKANLGAEIKQDLFRGIGTWLTSILGGVDVEQIANLETNSFTIGGVTITRVQAAKMGVSRAQMEQVFAAEATIDGKIEQLHLANAVVSAAQGIAIPTDIDPNSPQYRRFADQVMDRARELGVDLDKIYQEAYGQGIALQGAAGGTPSPELLQKVVDAIKTAATQKGEQYAISFEEEIRKPTEEALKQLYGFNATQLSLMSDSEIQQAAVLLSRNANGQYDIWFKELLTRLGQELANHEPAKPPKPTGVPTPGHIVQGAGAESVGPTSATAQTLRDARTTTEKLMSGYVNFINAGRNSVTEQIARQAASSFVQQYATQIEQAKKNPALRASLESLMGESWDQILKDFESQKQASGEALTVAMAQQFATTWKLSAKQGRDYAQDDVGLTVMNMLQQALDSDTLSPQAAKLVQQILTNAYSYSTRAAQKDVRDDLNTFVTTSLIGALSGADPKMKTALTTAWKGAMADSAKQTYPDATTAAEGLISAFIGKIPDKYGDTKKELETLFKNAVTDAEKNTDPDAQKSGKAFLQAFIDSLPAKYTTLKNALYTLLKDGATESSEDAKPHAAAAGKHFFEGVPSGVDTDDNQTKLRTTLATVLQNAAAGATPQPGSTLWQQLINAGILMITAIGQGIDAPNPTLSRAITSKTAYIAHHLPQSPVKEGPLKHPFLINAGRKIVEQIGEGMAQAHLSFTPKLSMPDAAGFGLATAAAAGAAAGQHINIDHMTLYDARDEQDILARMQFLAPTGR